VHTFKPNEIRHVHGVQYDPHAGKAWVCTGDHDQHSIIAWSTDTGKTLQVVGTGGQLCRTRQLAFTEDAVLWGADTGEEADAGIFRYDRKTRVMSRLCHVPGCIAYATALADGTIVMSTDRQGARNETDRRARLYVTDGRTVKSILMGVWKRPRLVEAHARLRLSRDPGAQELYVTCLNMTEHSGELLVISPEALEQVARPVKAPEAGAGATTTTAPSPAPLVRTRPVR
jgi:hypothetical protein